MTTPVLYVIAGPNGIGKTTSTFDLLPSGTPIINSDEIARLSSLVASTNINLQEYSNREALRLMDQYLQARKSFAIETNLADKETWKSLLQIQQSGYQLDVIYLSTDNLETLNARISERVLRGEHFVRPDVVFERYINGLKLLDFYFNHPDRLKLVDNSDTVKLIAEVQKGEIIHKGVEIPIWVSEHLGAHFQKKPEQQKSVRDMPSADDVRKAYLQKNKGQDD